MNDTEQMDYNLQEHIESILNNWEIYSDYDVFCGSISGSIETSIASPSSPLCYKSYKLTVDNLFIEDGKVKGIIYYGKVYPCDFTKTLCLWQSSPYIYRYPGGEDVLVDKIYLQKIT